MFKRKNPQGLVKNARKFMWPDSGFRRAGKYVLHRLARLPDSPYSIAAGLACGVAASMTPLLGLHFAIAALLAWLIGGNILASAIGTFFGSPWTFPFIWYFTFKFGNLILGMNPSELPQELSLSLLMNKPAKVLLPMMTGSVPAALFFGLATFFPARWIVTKYQCIRREKRMVNTNKSKTTGYIKSTAKRVKRA